LYKERTKKLQSIRRPVRSGKRNWWVRSRRL